jgi:hypothetical protein
MVLNFVETPLVRSLENTQLLFWVLLKLTKVVGFFLVETWKKGNKKKK